MCSDVFENLDAIIQLRKQMEEGELFAVRLRQQIETNHIIWSKRALWRTIALISMNKHAHDVWKNGSINAGGLWMVEVIVLIHWFEIKLIKMAMGLGLR